MFIAIDGSWYLADPLNRNALECIKSPKRLSNETIMTRILIASISVSLLGMVAGIAWESIGVSMTGSIVLLILVLSPVVAMVSGMPSNKAPLSRSFLRFLGEEVIIELPSNFLEAFDKLLTQHQVKEYFETTYRINAADFIAIRTVVSEFRRGLTEDTMYWENHALPEVLQEVVDRVKAAQQAEQRQQIETRERIRELGAAPKKS